MAKDFCIQKPKVRRNIPDILGAPADNPNFVTRAEFLIFRLQTIIRFNQINQNINNLANNMNQLTNKFNNIDNNIKQMAHTINNNFHIVDQEINQLNNRVDTLNQKVNDIRQNIP